LQALTSAIRKYVDSPARIEKHGRAARDRVLRLFSLEAMVAGYDRMYDRLLSIYDVRGTE
jgi:hypothetical protein